MLVCSLLHLSPPQLLLLRGPNTSCIQVGLQVKRHLLSPLNPAGCVADADPEVNGMGLFFWQTLKKNSCSLPLSYLSGLPLAGSSGLVGLHGRWSDERTPVPYLRPM